jgi:hypothetical protein
MKRLMILGGLLGFLIGLGFGSAQQSAWPAVMWRASAAALASGILLRWWGRVWIQGLEEVRRQREQTPSPNTPLTVTKTKA